ncbi:hypothetical protein SAMN05216378_3724 [Paenibacillus catalpae]|uniref:Uncharacterized protein n=1 Tax=Paenibacillus catalpae TaxID=1045775 RepID=A0A1I2BYU9_9BACL|nr:hypothetical protein SAMN05216378_3724 [Paenibacillus catalpae]
MIKVIEELKVIIQEVSNGVFILGNLYRWGVNRYIDA